VLSQSAAADDNLRAAASEREKVGDCEGQGEMARLNRVIDYWRIAAKTKTGRL
jgi:hypothetical protein